MCWTVDPVTDGVVLVRRGHKGYWPLEGMSKEAADKRNAVLGVTPAMRESMTYGSVFGWHIPLADPDEAERIFSLATPLEPKGGAQ